MGLVIIPVNLLEDFQDIQTLIREVCCYLDKRLQGSLGIPLPATTQWEIVEHSADSIEPVFEEMIRQAAQWHTRPLPLTRRAAIE